MFNSVKTDAPILSNLRDEILNGIQNTETDHVRITVDDVISIFKKLKHQKSDGLNGTDSDHFIYASQRFKVLVTDMINSMFVHGYTPSNLLNSVLCNIPKDLKGNLCNSDNYRGIALCSALCKVIDLYVIEKYDHLLFTSGM